MVSPRPARPEKSTAIKHNSNRISGTTARGNNNMVSACCPSQLCCNTPGAQQTQTQLHPSVHSSAVTMATASAGTRSNTRCHDSSSINSCKAPRITAIHDQHDLRSLDAVASRTLSNAPHNSPAKAAYPATAGSCSGLGSALATTHRTRSVSVQVQPSQGTPQQPSTHDTINGPLGCHFLVS